MSAKVLLILAVFAAVAYAADMDCPCDPDNEIENSALWSFLKKLSEEEPDVEDQDQRLDAVLPAVLSPLLECNCLQDKTRRKRKVLSSPESTESYEDSNYSDEDLPPYESRKDPKCAVGYYRYGFLCVPAKIAMEK